MILPRLKLIFIFLICGFLIHAQKLKKADIRAEIDDRNEKIGKKIRDTELMRVPYMLVVGEKEMNENKVAIRRQGKGDMGVNTVDAFMQELLEEVRERRG